jgi:hypothetical protein
MDRNLDGLSRELTCLIELGALSEEETGALCACLEDLRQLLACSRVPDAPGPSARTQTAVDLTELSGRTGFLAADIDLAYQRLGVAA